MAKVGDIVSVDGAEYVLTENGLVPGERMGWAKNALLGAGASAQEYGQNIGNLLGLVSDDQLAAGAADRAAFRQASGAQNPGAATTGAVALEAPLGLIGGKWAQAGIGAAQGFAQPTDEGLGGRLVNSLLGAGLSLGGDVAGEMAGRVVKSITSAAAPPGGTIMGMMPGAGGAGGRGAGNVVSDFARGAEEMGFRLTPGQKTGSDALRTLELGFEANPVTTSWVRDLQDHNARLLTTKIGQAAGISPETMAATGGRITPEAIEEGLANVTGYFDQLGGKMESGIDVPKPLLERIAKRVDLADLKENGVGFQRWEDGILQGRDYQELRSSLTALADSDRLLPSEVAAIGSQIDALDMAVSRNLPEGELGQFQRAREQWRVLDKVMKGQTLNGEGLINPRTAETKLRQAFGDAPYLTGNYRQSMPNGTVIDFQPETGEALKALRMARNSDLAPFVGSSGTGERAAASNFLQDVMGAVQGDKESLGNIIGMGKLGQAYEYIGERNPQALLDLIQGNPGAFVRQVGGAGGAAGREQNERGAD